jgi:hypothetical protein
VRRNATIGASIHEGTSLAAEVFTHVVRMSVRSNDEVVCWVLEQLLQRQNTYGLFSAL